MRSLPIFLAVGLIAGCSRAPIAPASTATPAKGRAIATKSKALELTVPPDWEAVDPLNPSFLKALTQMGQQNLEARFNEAANSTDLMVMNTKSPDPEFLESVNVVPAGDANVKSEDDLESIYEAMRKQFAPNKLEHKLIGFPIGPTVCVWGSILQNGASSDMITYAFSSNGKGYVISFATKKGNLEAFRGLTESIMQTVVAK